MHAMDTIVRFLLLLSTIRLPGWCDEGSAWPHPVLPMLIPHFTSKNDLRLHQKMDIAHQFFAFGERPQPFGAGIADIINQPAKGAI